MAATKPILITADVGNNPSRIRLLIYWKGLESHFEMRTPADYGGMASPEYRALNPQGKMPTLVLPDGTALYESRVISAYIVDKYADVGPSCIAPTPEARATANLILSIHDLYIASPNGSHPSITATQGCGYKPIEVIGAEARAIKLAELAKQLAVLEGLAVGPYLAGDTPTEADFALYPTLGVFLDFIVPRVFGWPSLLDATNHPKLTAWVATVAEWPAAKRVRDEMLVPLNGWESSGRFEPIKQQIAAAGELQWSRAALVTSQAQ
jgi:glutathione S-transferase